MTHALSAVPRLAPVLAPAAEPITRAEAKEHLRVESSVTADDQRIDGLIRAARVSAERATNRQLVIAHWDVIYDRFPVGGAPLWLPRPPLRKVQSVTYVDTDGVTQTWSADEYDVDGRGEPGRLVPAYNETYPDARAQIGAVTVRITAGHTLPFTVDAGTDVITAAGHPYADGDIIPVLRNSDGALPAGLAEATSYHARDVSGDTLKLAASAGGAAIDITGAGTGVHWLDDLPEDIRQAMLLLIGHWYEHREEVVVGAAPSALPVDAARHLLAGQRVTWFE